MSNTLKVFDGETEIATARIEVNAIGSGCIVVATLVDPDDTAIMADSVLLPDWKYDMDGATKAASELLTDMRKRLEATVTAPSDGEA